MEFQYSTTIGEHIITILQKDEGFDLRIDNIPFEKLNHVSSAGYISPYFDQPKRIEEPSVKEEQKAEHTWNDNKKVDKAEIPGIFANRRKASPKVNKSSELKVISKDLLSLNFNDFGEAEKVERKNELVSNTKSNKIPEHKVDNLLDAFDF